MSELDAKRYVMLSALRPEEKSHLKQLLDTGVIVPGAVIGAEMNELRDTFEANPPGLVIDVVISFSAPITQAIYLCSYAIAHEMSLGLLIYQPIFILFFHVLPLYFYECVG